MEDFQIDPNAHHESVVNQRKTEDTEYAKSCVRLAGKAIAPPNSEYLGSAVVHYYKKGLSYELVTQCQTRKVPEQLAAQGGNQLFRDLMQVFGHKPPARRK